MEHGPNDLRSVLAHLQAVAAYPVTPVVRVPVADVVVIKQVLDLGAQNLLVPMVSSAAEARSVVEAARYPPHGRRGVGSALARSARWNRVDGYLGNDDEFVSVVVQVETFEAVEAAAEIAAVDGVDGVLVALRTWRPRWGCSASRPTPKWSRPCGAPSRRYASRASRVGVNAFDPAVADAYVAEGAAFVLVAADVAMLACGSEALATRFIGAEAHIRASY